MNPGEGMVAVVRGLPDAGLALTLMEGGRQYTLLPNAALHNYQQPLAGFTQMAPRRHLQNSSTETHPGGRIQQGIVQHSAAQAVDGHYASVYKVAHCKLEPTSPSIALAEFPPQRAEPCRGHGNFEVGGLGSGEFNHTFSKAHGSYKGAMNWPDRGAVCTPRATHEPDPFAESLRRYPSLSPQRSAELIDRLISYTQARNHHSPVKSRSPRPPGLSAPSGQGCERRCVAAAMRDQRVCDSVSIRTKMANESPTKDTCRKIDLDSGDFRSVPFSRTYDVQYVRESGAKDKFKAVPIASSHVVSPDINEKCSLPFENKSPNIVGLTDSIHKETQADVPMISREVATVPRTKPTTRNVEVSLSLSSTRLESSKQHHHRKVQVKCSCKSIQTTKPTDLSLQTCISSVNVNQDSQKKTQSCRKAKSQEEFKANNDIAQDFIQLMRESNSNSDSKTEYNVGNELLKQIHESDNSEQRDRYKVKLGRCIKDQLYPQMDFKMFTKELSNELISTIKANNMILGNFNRSNDVKENKDSNNGSSDDKIKYLDELIKDWLDDVPIKPVDFLGRHVEKGQVVQTIAIKIKSLITDKDTDNGFDSLKPKLLDILEDIPLEVNARNKVFYLKRIVNDLVEKIESLCSINTRGRKQWKRAVKDQFKNELFKFKHAEPTELKQFVKQEIKDFLAKFHLNPSPDIEKQIQIELINILINSIEDIRCGNDEQTKEDILAMLTDFTEISEVKGISFVNHLIYSLKNMLKESLIEYIQQSFIVLQNSLPSTSRKTQNHTNDFSIEEISDQDIIRNLNTYTKQIVQQINEWMENIQGMREIDKNFKNVVAQDLADDIIDRHKYLELNPNSKGTDADELEHLKYQIFKWVNKLVGEDNLNTISQASDLMQRIRNIPVPMLARPVHNIDTNPPANFEQKPGTISSIKGMKDASPSPKKKKKCHCSATNTSKSRNSKEITEKDSSPDKIPNEFGLKSKDSLALTKNCGVMTNPEENPKSVAFTETDMSQIPKTRPRSTSMNVMKPPREEPRRGSGPAEFSSGCNAGRTPNIVPPQLRCSTNKPIATTSIKQLSDEYDQYLQNWIEQIPISTSNPEEQALIEKMRLGIYNGVWKALTKLHMNPTTLDNPFYYQDVLDDEIEELLDLLPQSNELTNKKQTLKIQIIEKTINMNQQIFDTTASSSYKQQLVDNITNNLPRTNLGMVGSDAMKICEEILKLNLAEDYIMSVLYREVDQVKANVYKKKLMKHMQEFFDFMKTTHGIEAKDIPLKSYRDEIISALAKVPMPSNDTIREEGDEILIGIEIEQWFSDLPLYPTENRVEMLCRKRYIDTLAKKVHIMERQSSLNNFEDELRHEIKRFMGKLPLKSEDVDNKPFMIEELINRLKNRPRDLGNRPERVLFIDPNDYDEFSRDMPHCSSFSNAPDAKKPQINQSSYIIVGGERVNASYAQNLKNRHNLQEPESEIDWLTMLPDSAQQVPNQTAQGCQNGPPVGPSEFQRASQLASGQMSANQASHQGTAPGHSTCSKTCAASVKTETSSGQLPRDFSFQQPMAESMHGKPSLRPGQCIKKPEAYVSGPYPEQTVPPRRGSFIPTDDCPGTQEFECSKSNSPRRMPGTTATNGFEPEVFSRTYENNQDGPQNRRRYSDKSYTQSHDFFSQPMGFSTPQQNGSPPRESRPKKRKTRELNSSGRNTARRKLSLSDSGESVKEEVRCQCMERVWRTKKKSSACCPCEECSMDFPPFFAMRYPPFPFYF